MQRRIVFCADDLGISPGTNEGIRDAAEAGLVKETSLCVTGIAMDEGLEVARSLADSDSGSLSVGLHLSFTLGRSLTGPLPALTDDEGVFLPLPKVLRACLFRKVNRTQVAAEVEAQIARLADHGIQPTHLNGHHHVHSFPVIRDAVVPAMQRWKIGWTRLPQERKGPVGRFSLRRMLLDRFARGLRESLAGSSIRSLPFVGLSIQDRADYRDIFVRTLEGLPPGDYEWMVHPRAPDPSFAKLDHLGHERGSQAPAELATLTDPALVRQVADLGIECCSFADLS